MIKPATYDNDNIFAKILKGEMPCHKVFEDDHTFVFMDIMPRSQGHCLVIPKTPARNILDVDGRSLQAVIATTQHLSKAVIRAFDADGVTIHQFNEPAAGQIVYHLHFHVIPRFEGIRLRPHTGEMEDNDVLTANAERIRQVL